MIKKHLEKIGLTWEDVEAADLLRQELHWSVDNIHLDVSWMKLWSVSVT